MPFAAFTPQTPISTVLETLPEAAAVFIAKGTDCVGCMIAHFCTLEEMSLHYGLKVEDFLTELEELTGGR
jgi:hybrid cluster-associated redox disulfide protein